VERLFERYKDAPGGIGVSHRDIAKVQVLDAAPSSGTPLSERETEKDPGGEDKTPAGPTPTGKNPTGPKPDE
jgi:hypothetical protein